jgi:hypothetical protein
MVVKRKKARQQVYRQGQYSAMNAAIKAKRRMNRIKIVNPVAKEMAKDAQKGN